MRFRRSRYRILEGDLTPMIDMTFLLVAFFMLVINFSEVEKDHEIQLPDSRLARVPDRPPEYQIVLNLNPDGSVVFAGNVIERIEFLRPVLSREISIARRDGVPAGNVDVIIRSDRDTATGLVQELIAQCQEAELENFSLRVRERLR